MNIETDWLDRSAVSAVGGSPAVESDGRSVRRLPESVSGLARIDRHAAAMALGATMYVPAVHSGIEEVVAGRRYPALKSLVICLEDALHTSDVERGLQLLGSLLHNRKSQLASDPGARAPGGPKLFLRPRGLAMARAIVRYPGIEGIDGLVIPKVGIDDLGHWWQLALDADLQLMPTLEDAWVFDPMALREFSARLAELDQNRLIAVRIGGNDLMASLRLRRQRGKTLYDSPLAWGLAQMMCQLGSRGFPLTAPVFDVIDDDATLAEECRLDAEFGFVGKTAIHPAQIAVIERGFRVRQQELDVAHKALALDADAVFRSGGMMIEPATHRAWARRIVAQAAAYGLVEDETDQWSDRGLVAKAPGLS